MLNNLKSDLYRMLHTKSFYITLFVNIFIYILLLGGYGIVCNTTFARFSRETDTFTQFLFYLPKSGVFQCLVLIFLALFFSDEYNSGFQKNVYPLQVKKHFIVIERFIFSFVVVLINYVCVLVCSLLYQCINPLEVGNFDFIQLALFTFIQFLFLCAASGIIALIVHATRSRVLSVLFAAGYSMFLLYFALSGISYFMFENDVLVRYTLYQNAGSLPTVFQWDSHETAMIVLFVGLLLYHGISCIVLKKKDIA